MSATAQLLAGLQLVSLAINLPGPLAAKRLQQWGLAVVKVEPPGGDPLATAQPEWYAAVCGGQQVHTLDLKSAAGRAQLDTLLGEADLLLTATRPAALQRLGLGWDDLHARFPNLCQVAIVGLAPPRENEAGHDLTYQAELGLLAPPAMPRTLIADLAGAEQAANAALALLLGRERGRGAGYAAVALADAARDFAAPLRYGLTVPQGRLGGALPGYNLYRTRPGWVAVAALEPHFLRRLFEALGLAQDATYADVEAALAVHPADYWVRWALERDLPLVAISNIVDQ